MTPVERRILIKVSTMYYLEHMKQTEIAKRLGVERTTVSKHLKRALEQGIVTITVANENFEDIESAKWVAQVCNFFAELSRTNKLSVLLGAR